MITIETCKAIDDQLSHRPIALDPGGYFIIFIDRAEGQIVAHHYTNVINDRGLAVDPDTGEVIPARGKVIRTPTTTFCGQTAKQLCVTIFEQTTPCPVTQLNHAAYLGRELQRAEWALLHQMDYCQD